MKEDAYTMLGQYNCGMNEAWSIAREIMGMSPYERRYLFGYEDAKYIFRMFEPKEVKEIISNREKKESFLTELELLLKKNGREIDREYLERFIDGIEETE